MQDIEKQTVDMIPNYDGQEEEPSVLPARIPNLLLNGASERAVGWTTNIRPPTLREITAGVKHQSHNPEPPGEPLLSFVRGPDFQRGGIITGTAGIKAASVTGHGRIVVRARHTFEQAPNGRERIIIDELPYAVNKATLVAKIAELVSERRLEGIADLRDESDRQGMRVVIELKREARVFTVLNNLYKHTSLQSTFGAIMLAIVDGRPVVLSLKQALQLFIDHRRQVIVRRTRFDLERAQERAHILEGLKICLDHLDEVIKTIRAAADTDTAATHLQTKFGLSERQARAVLALTLGRLTKLERGKIDAEYEEVIKTIAYLESVLASDQKVRLLIKGEMDDLAKKYGDDRRTEITDQEATELSAEDLVPKEEVVVTLTHRGYVKRQPLRVFRAQKRGGVGLKGARPTASSEAPSGTREEDYALHLLTTHTHASMLFFTQSGRVFQLRVHEVPERERQANGGPGDGSGHARRDRDQAWQRRCGGRHGDRDRGRRPPGYHPARVRQANAALGISDASPSGPGCLHAESHRPRRQASGGARRGRSGGGDPGDQRDRNGAAHAGRRHLADRPPDAGRDRDAAGS